jgi:hypothetical protein
MSDLVSITVRDRNTYEAAKTPATLCFTLALDEGVADIDASLKDGVAVMKTTVTDVSVCVIIRETFVVIMIVGTTIIVGAV